MPGRFAAIVRLLAAAMLGISARVTPGTATQLLLLLLALCDTASEKSELLFDKPPPVMTSS
jgi:hypothetical protein